MIGNIYIHVPSEIQKLEDFGKGLEHYFKTPQDFINALNKSYQISDAIINGRGGAYIQQQQQQKKMNKDAGTFYTMPCEFFDQHSKPYEARDLAMAIANSKMKPFLMIFTYNDKDKNSMEFTSEIRSWFTEHLELRKYFPTDDEAMAKEPKRLLLMKFKDEKFNHTYSFVILDSVIYKQVGRNSNAYALVIFNAESKNF